MGGRDGGFSEVLFVGWLEMRAVLLFQLLFRSCKSPAQTKKTLHHQSATSGTAGAALFISAPIYQSKSSSQNRATNKNPTYGYPQEKPSNISSD